MPSTERPAWRTAPDRAVLAWAAAAIGSRARVRSVHPLGSGIAEATDAVTIDDASGRRHRLVLHRWIRPGWETDDPGFDPAKEAAVLAALALTAVPAPTLVAIEKDGSRAGVPALLTVRLPGRPPSARRMRSRAALATLGERLAEIHRVGAAFSGDVALRRVVLAYAPFGDLARPTIRAPRAGSTSGARRSIWPVRHRLAPLARPSSTATTTLGTRSGSGTG